MGNIFKISQIAGSSQSSISVIGTNTHLTVPIGKTGYKIEIAPLLNSIISQFSSSLKDAQVNVIDTSPIAQSDVLGLDKVDIHNDGKGYIDREKGKIYVDVQKITDHIMKQMLPPNVQLPNEGASVDVDLKKNIVKKVYDAVAREIADTVIHEATHNKRTILNIMEHKPVEFNPESDALSAGHSAGKAFRVSLPF
jgi:hypothetical protein